MGVVDNGRSKRETDAVRALLVDDETTFRETLAKVLQRRGFFVGIAAIGEEGLGVLRADDFDVVLIEHKMPGIGGGGMSASAIANLLKPHPLPDLVARSTAAAASRARESPGPPGGE